MLLMMINHLYDVYTKSFQSNFSLYDCFSKSNGMITNIIIYKYIFSLSSHFLSSLNIYSKCIYYNHVVIYMLSSKDK